MYMVSAIFIGMCADLFFFIFQLEIPFYKGYHTAGYDRVGKAKISAFKILSVFAHIGTVNPIVN